MVLFQGIGLHFKTTSVVTFRECVDNCLNCQTGYYKQSKHLT